MILAIDIGTSSVRAALYDHAGKIIPKTLVKNERQLRHTSDGGSEIDADKAFSQFASAIDDVLKRSEKIVGSITHVATSCFWHSLVGVNAERKPTTKVFSWADNRSREQVTVLRKRLNEGEVHNRTGARFHSSFWPAKLLWIRQTQPNAFDQTSRWLSLSDYFVLRLFNEAVTSVSMASATGIFNIRECMWDAPLLAFLKIKKSKLPLLSDRETTFTLNKKLARRWPRLANAEWFPAIGDGAANNIGSGCMSRQRAALMIGTSGAMRVAYRGEPPNNIPAGLWCYRVDRERVIVGGALSDGGGLYAWLKESLRLPSNVENMIAKRPPGSHGVEFLPFLAGERSTGYHENARGAVLGLISSTDVIDIAQAAMESVGYRFAEILDQLDKVEKIQEIVASGGALTSSKVWTQMIADILGRKLMLLDEPEASLRGAVLLALETIGNIEHIEEISRDRTRVFEPNPTDHAVYRSTQKRHQRLYDLLITEQ